MYYSLIFFFIFNFVMTVVISEDNDGKILRYEHKNFGKRENDFSYETTNGITKKESGRLMNDGQDNEHVAVDGSTPYSFKFPDEFKDQTGQVVNSSDPLPMSVTTGSYRKATRSYKRATQLPPAVLASLVGGG